MRDCVYISTLYYCTLYSVQCYVIAVIKSMFSLKQ